MLENYILIHVAIVILGISGFMVAKYIYHHKKTGKLLVCPIRFDCNTVVNSDYSRFFGIPVEFLGMFYYSIISLWHIILIFSPSFFSSIPIDFSLIISTTAFLFSLYLIGVQIFALKKGCSWCLVSAFISTLIFIFTVFS